MYPFLFWKPNIGLLGQPIYDGALGCYHVIIASHIDYMTYNSAWMENHLGEACFVPDVDLSESYHQFDTEEDALTFIREWWKNSAK
jgi:hypothetical protein